jgi:pterin-4a-carbinolamine dehydratase
MDSKNISDFIKKYIPSWSIESNKLSRSYETKNWNDSMSKANVISYLAEYSNHHPEICIKYYSINVKLFTHDEGEITEKDLNLAQIIDEFLTFPKGL